MKICLLITVGVAFAGASTMSVALIASAMPEATPPAGIVCTGSGPVTGLDDEQSANARTIVAVTYHTLAQLGPGPDGAAATIALMTAYQESGLRDLANPSVPGSGLQPEASGDGTDHDSVGLFQQRDSWGTVAQRMDPDEATTAFLSKLITVPGWQSMPPGAVAQDVQVSAYPTAYTQWYPVAAQWLNAIRSGPQAGLTHGDCLGEQSTEPVPTNQNNLRRSVGPLSPGAPHTPPRREPVGRPRTSSHPRQRVMTVSAPSPHGRA